MTNRSYVITDTSLSVLINGSLHQTDRNNPAFRQIVEAMNDDATTDEELIGLFAPISVIQQVKEVRLEDGRVFWGDEEIHSSLQRRMIDVFEAGLDIDPWVKLMTNIYLNPSPTARTEFYDFFERANLPMTPDGHIVAFKKVTRDGDRLVDCRTGTFDNSVGNVVEMERGEVDPIRDNLCSTGLHFCSKSYLPHTPGEVTLLVKINPADIVSIPTDYDQAKGRTCRYEVVGIIEQDVAQSRQWDPVVGRYGAYSWDVQDDIEEDLDDEGDDGGYDDFAEFVDDPSADDAPLADDEPDDAPPEEPTVGEAVGSALQRFLDGLFPRKP